ncbi:MAG TPA: DUF4388 domain-containing protein [Thermodesulfobacteriota bacterium]
MSLVGNLEDLGLGDILQIVSLSRKSGILYLRAEPDADGRRAEGEIIFQNGQVVRAISTEASQNLGELLVARGIITGQQLVEALGIQRAGGGRERLGQILVKHLGIPADKIQEAIRKQTEAVVYTFFQWTRGDFSFELKEADGALDKVDIELRHMVLDTGLNPQFLAMEGTRLKDEAKTGRPVDPATLPVKAGAAAPAAAADRNGHVPAGGDGAAEPGREAAAPEAPPAAGEPDPFADLSLDASELAEPPRVVSPDLPAAPPVPPPPEAPAAPPGPSPRPRRFSGPTVNLSEELGLSPAQAALGGQSSRGLAMLKAMVSELTSPEAHGQITLLILRFASELMRRAVLFLVKEEEVVGLGQFGIELPDGENPDRVVRGIKVPLDEPSIFTEVLRQRAAVKAPLGDGRWDAYLVDKLGGHRPVEVFCAPISSGSTIAAVLYADNAPEAAPIGDTEALEIFLHQAGLQMEKALLERKIRELNRPAR